MRDAESIAKGFAEKMCFFAPEIRYEKVLEFVRYVQRDARSSDSAPLTDCDLAALEKAAFDAVFGLEQLAKEEAERKGTTFEMCNYTFTKRLRAALDVIVRNRVQTAIDGVLENLSEAHPDAKKPATLAPVRSPDAGRSEKWGGTTYFFGQVQVTIDRRHEPNTWSIQLPHSCDEWEIGRTFDAVKQFKDDLDAAYAFIQNVKL